MRSANSTVHVEVDPTTAETSGLMVKMTAMRALPEREGVVAETEDQHFIRLPVWS